MTVSVTLRHNHIQRGTPVVMTGDSMTGLTGVVVIPPASQIGNVRCALDSREREKQIWIDQTCMEADLSYSTGRMHVVSGIARLLSASDEGAHYHRDGDSMVVHGMSFEIVRTYKDLGLDPDDTRTLPDGSMRVNAEALARIYNLLRQKR